MWGCQNIQFTPEEERILDEVAEEMANAGGVIEDIPWTAEDQAAVDAEWAIADAACAKLRAQKEAAAARERWELAFLCAQEEQARLRASRASRRKRMVLDTVRRSTHLR